MNNELRQMLSEYNWDDGYFYLINKSRNSSLSEWKLFIEKIYTDILEGKYIQTASTFTNPLTKVQKYKLKKTDTGYIPNRFINFLFSRALLAACGIEINSICERKEYYELI